jgi:hypothetical protein
MLSNNLRDVPPTISGKSPPVIDVDVPSIVSPGPFLNTCFSPTLLSDEPFFEDLCPKVTVKTFALAQNMFGKQLKNSSQSLGLEGGEEVAGARAICKPRFNITSVVCI